MTEEELDTIYNWVDEIPLSRPKKNIARDFSDCVLMVKIDIFKKGWNYTLLYAKNDWFA